MFATSKLSFWGWKKYERSIEIDESHNPRMLAQQGRDMFYTLLPLGIDAFLLRTRYLLRVHVQVSYTRTVLDILLHLVYISYTTKSEYWRTLYLAL